MSTVETITEAVEVCPYTPRQHIVQGVILATAVGAVCSAVAWQLAKRRYAEALAEIESDIEDRIEAKVMADRRKREKLGRIIRKEGYLASPEEAAKHLIPDENQLRLDEEVEEEPEEEPHILGVTAEEIAESMQSSDEDDEPEGNYEDHVKDPDWDWDAELDSRNTNAPYVIHEEEFLQNEPDHEQTAVTYFTGDDVLADETDEPIPAVIVGSENLERFGSGTDDPNVVHIRNEGMNMDFEVTRSNGFYSEEVLGLGEYLKHADAPRFKPMRRTRPRPPRDD